MTELAHRFDGLYTAVIADVLDELGRLHQTLPPELRPLAPGTRLAGPAFVIEGRPASGGDREESLRAFLTALGAVPPGAVAVYVTGDDESAQFGELSAESLAARGCAGVVVDGGCRDVDFIVRSGFPVFCRYMTPRDSVARWETTRWGHEATVGDVRVASGDWIVGDADGLVAVPADLAADVAERAEAAAATENEVRTAVRDGISPLEAYDRYGKF